MNKLKSTALLVGIVSMAFNTSCKKEEPELRDEKIGGCLNEDSPIFSSEADFDDESCVYAYVNAYEITFHPEKDESGSDWDFLTNTDADLLFRIREVGDTDWMFESPEMSNQAHNDPAKWTAPSNIKLLNRDYEWDLYDADTGSSDDFVASGTFNPIELADDGEIITIGTNSSGNTTQLILTYQLEE